MFLFYCLSPPAVKLAVIKELRVGQNTKNFKSTGDKFASVKELSFSIIFGKGYTTVDIVCQSAKDYLVWAKGETFSSLWEE